MCHASRRWPEAELDGVAHSLFLVCAEALKIILSRTSPYLHAGMAFGLSQDISHFLARPIPFID